MIARSLSGTCKRAVIATIGHDQRHVRTSGAVKDGVRGPPGEALRPFWARERMATME